MGFTSRAVAPRQAREVQVTSGLMSSLRAAGGSTAGQTVNKTTAITVPAIGAAVAFRASHVASLEMGTYLDDGSGIPQKVTSRWQSRLLRGVPNPTQDWYMFWQIVESSLAYRGNAYVWKSKDATGRVTALTALHPDQVAAFINLDDAWHLRYPVMFTPWYPCPPDVGRSTGILTVGRETVWHIRGRECMGDTIAPSPIQRYAASIGVALGKQDYEASLYENGILGGMVVTFPSGMNETQAAKWKSVWNSEQAGTSNAGKTKVVGGGATVSQIGMTQKDAQFVESSGMSAIDVCNIFGVPAYFLNINEKAEKSVLPEHEEARWVNHYLGPELRRIEQSMYADPDMFGPASSIVPRFDSAGLIHPDASTKASILQGKVQSGQWTPDEARAADGMPPLPDGYGEVPIFVPVGGSPFGMPDASGGKQGNQGNGSEGDGNGGE